MPRLSRLPRLPRASRLPPGGGGGGGLPGSSRPVRRRRYPHVVVRKLGDLRIQLAEARANPSSKAMGGGLILPGVLFKKTTVRGRAGGSRAMEGAQL